MKLMVVLSVAVIAIVVSGCATTITAPVSGPTANLIVEVTNFAPERKLTNIENVYFTLRNGDESWGGQQLIKNDKPSFSFSIPAQQELTYILNLMQGGGGFSGTCGVQFDLTPPAGANLVTKFEFSRAGGSEVVGCKVGLYLDNKLVESYAGSAEITRYKVKLVY